MLLSALTSLSLHLPLLAACFGSLFQLITLCLLPLDPAM